MEDEYDSIPAYEAPHKRDDEGGNHKKSRKRGVQYPDREFDRRWDRKKREAEEAKAGFQIVGEKIVDFQILSEPEMKTLIATRN